MADLRRATLQDLPGVYRVCLRTGDGGRDASDLYANPDLLGHVFVGPYVVGEPDLALVAADDQGIAGYCLAARDTRAFVRWAEASWWPSLREQYPRRDDGTLDAEVIELLHEPPVAPPEIVEGYPAHLHIDLLERVRGTGAGRRLIEMQLARLAALGAPACHLTVGTSNENAIAFYRHLRWQVLLEGPEDTVMGIRLG